MGRGPGWPADWQQFDLGWDPATVCGPPMGKEQQ